MRANLNTLTNEEIEELEKFVKSRIKKENKDIEKFLNDLKSGKLKNKNVEVDALDFVADGLTDIVGAWIKSKELPKSELKEKKTEAKAGKTEKIVCAPNTRVGIFLNKYNKKQVDLEEGINNLKQSGRLSEVLNVIADTETRREYFKLGFHDLNHTKRVLLNASMIMNMRNELSARERQIIFKAIEYHDTGRVDDSEDKIHGERAVQKFSNELNEFSEEEQELIKFIIIQHCKSTRENEESINNLNKSEEEKAKYRKFLNYMKDADKLDRVRFPEVIPMMSDSLDPERLYFDESKQLIKFACGIYDKSDALFSMKNSKSKDDLFSRKKVFAECEAGEELANSVDKFLKENGYPERSKNIDIKKVKEQNPKFIKDGYLYLLRGSRKGQTSGFFTYPYAMEKKNVEQYLREHPETTADILASQQTMKGRERFISTTTDITIAAEFTKLDRKKNISGSIYVIRVKPEDAFRIDSPLALEKFWGDDMNGDESEYLIPDFIKPEEILKEFKYNDYLGIFDYLKNEIGLNIKKEDINLADDISKQIALSDEELEILCKRNERNDEFWKNSSSSDEGFQLITKLANEGKGKTTFEKLFNGIFGSNPFDER